MAENNRRDFLARATAIGIGGLTWQWGPLRQSPLANANRSRSSKSTNDPIYVSTFRVDATPPLGHSCCGGWIKPIEQVGDALEAIGVVLSGNFEPIVLCAIDWTGILNQTHLSFRKAIASAVGTQPDRVALQCVHQHNAPFACEESQAFVEKHNDLPPICDTEFVARLAKQIGKAATESINLRTELTHVELGQAKVDKVASNRRLVNQQGELVDWRGSKSSSQAHKDAPEGLIDPWLKVIRLCSHDQPIVAMHYYATHPMSFYGDGIATSDFVGLARKQKQERYPDVKQIYWTGCSGNVAAGKYNDGSPEARVALTKRIFDAMLEAEKNAERFEIREASWQTRELQPVPKESLDREALNATMANQSESIANRNRSAFQLAWLDRFERKQPIVLSSLHLGPATILHLPAESFIEYQLDAQKVAGERFLATAAYGDGGPWYIPTREAYPQGGYEVGVAWCAPQIDELMHDGFRPLVTKS